MTSASTVNARHFDRHWSSRRRLLTHLQYNAVYTRQLVAYGIRASGIDTGYAQVLDIGFGGGDHLFLLDQTAYLNGLELSAAAIETARAGAQRRGYKHVALLPVSSSGNLPYRDRAFDLIISSHVLEHLGDDRFMLLEITRTLKPGAPAIIQIPIDRFESRVMGESDLINPDFLAGVSDHVRCYSTTDFRSRVAEAGLTVVLELEAGRPMDVLQALERRVRSPLRQRHPAADRVVSALVNVPLAVLPFSGKRLLDRVLAPTGLRNRYGLWVVRRAE